MDVLKGQQLLKKSGIVVDANEALENKRIICFYFSAHWCPPCKVFTPVLTEFYMVSPQVIKTVGTAKLLLVTNVGHLYRTD